jgi:D-alanyl-D-alanine carboxypeptidase/D-alanyl-D-alanine-endopeptidase (penicillin-binding protein 4)
LWRIAIALNSAILACAVCLLHPAISLARQPSSISTQTLPISSQDALLVADPAGHIIYSKNETRKCVPGSTLKILTALAAIHHLRKSYRFRTDFYQDHDQHLKVKGYGDPMLITEVWKEMAQAIACRVRSFKDLLFDDTFFVCDIHIPGVGFSTNPYDAPNGALCANFNTVFFKQDGTGKIVSAEAQTPMTPFALERLRLLGSTSGRFTLCHNGHDAALYAGELLVYFLRESGKVCQGEVRAGVASPSDSLVYTYHSVFTLEDVLKKMFEFSNNFVANQILLALGAHVHGPPATLAKGVRVLSDYAREVLHLNDVEITEGSGISRENRLSALDMLAVLKRFEAHRGLLVRKGGIFYKSGTLKGVRTRAGYIESRSGNPYCFVIFLNNSRVDIDSIVDRVKSTVLKKSLDNG